MLDPSLLVGVGAAGGVVVALGTRGVMRLFTGRGGTFSGTWEQLVQDARGGVRARDTVTCRQSGNLVEGAIRRTEPMLENYKEWQFRGRVTDGLLSAIYWSADPGRTPAVHGSLYLGNGPDGSLAGLLSTRQLTQHADGFLESALEGRIAWRRPGTAEADNPESKNP